jgi:type II secretory pathway pseudopilin PulG
MTLRSTSTRARASGFTLIEVLGVILLMTIVIGVALDFYVDLSNATTRATDGTRKVRRATAVIDRIARDLEGATLVQKPGGRDRFDHPWVFVGESRYTLHGADHVKFITGSFTPKRSDDHESNVAVVAYTLEREEDDRLSLRRYTSPRLPEGLDTDFPFPEDSLLLASDVRHFGVRFRDDEGEWHDEWDSSQIVRADQLPAAVEIGLALYDPFADRDELDELDFEAVDEFGDEVASTPELFTRTVALPVRPIDLAMLLDPEGPYGTKQNDGSGDDGDGDGEEDDSDTSNDDDDDGSGNADGSGDEDDKQASNEPCTTGPTVAQCFNNAAVGNDPRGLQNQSVWGASQKCFSTHGHLMDQDFVLPGCF